MLMRMLPPSLIYIYGPPWQVTISNDDPVWERIFAMTLPVADSSSSVSPAFGFLAPVGGCDNLCNEQERYSDSCTLVVVESPDPTRHVDWLLV
jgi:hypothetical protein